MAKILIIEDNLEFAEHVQIWLEAESHRVEIAGTAQIGRDLLEFSSFDAIILDWELPDGSGIDLCTNYRSNGGTTPILFLTGKNHLQEKVAGFHCGADDYLTKPCELKELTVRITALLRRPAGFIPNVMGIGPFQIDMVARQVRKNGVLIELAPREFDLLQFLVKHPNEFYTAEQLIVRVWSSDSDVTLQAVSQSIKRLRQKIDNSEGQSFIKTRRGIGYGFSVEPEL